MKLYIKYIIKKLAILIIMISMALTAIIFMSQSLRYLALVTNHGIGLIDFFKLSILITPSLFMIILPISVFISVIYVYNKLIMDGELIVLSSSGLSRMSLSLPALIVALLVVITSYFISLYLLPTSYRVFKDKLTFYRENYTSILLEEGVFNDKVKGLTIYLEERKPDNTMKGLFIYDTRTNKSATIMAESAKLIQKDDMIAFELYNGNRQEINKYGELDILYFDYFVYNLEFTPDNSHSRWRDPQERYINELLFAKDEEPKMINKLKAEGHYRLTWPLLNMILTLIALIAIYPQSFSRRGQNRRIILTSIYATFISAILITLNNAISIMPSMVLILYIWILITIIISYYVLFGRYRPI